MSSSVNRPTASPIRSAPAEESWLWPILRTFGGVLASATNVKISFAWTPVICVLSRLSSNSLEQAADIKLMVTMEEEMSIRGTFLNVASIWRMELLQTGASETEIEKALFPRSSFLTFEWSDETDKGTASVCSWLKDVKFMLTLSNPLMTLTNLAGGKEDKLVTWRSTSLMVRCRLTAPRSWVLMDRMTMLVALWSLLEAIISGMKDRVLNVAFEETQVHRLGLSPTSLHLLHTIPVEVGAIAALPYFYYWLEKMYVCAK